MGARVSRQQHQDSGPPCDQNQECLSVANEGEEAEENRKLTPTSLVITICMLKMEPNNDMMTNDQTKPSSSPSKATTTTTTTLSSPEQATTSSQPQPQPQPKCRCFHNDNCNNNGDNQNIITPTSTSSCNKLNNLNKLSNNNQHHHHNHHLLHHHNNSGSVTNTNLNIICDNKNNNNNTNLINQTIQQHQHQIQLEKQQLLLSNQNNQINLLNNNNNNNNNSSSDKFNINVINDKFNDITMQHNTDDVGYNNINDCSVIPAPTHHLCGGVPVIMGGGGYSGGNIVGGDEKILNTNESTSTSSPMPTATTTSNCCRRKTLASLTSSKRSRGCKLCRSSSCSNSHVTSLSTTTPTCCNKDKDGSGTPGKSKKGNWGLKFNCAKLRGSTKSSSSTSSSSSSLTFPNNLNIESEKTDSCICTAYRKVEDLPSSAAAASSTRVLPRLENNVQIFPSATITTTSSNTSAFILPSTATAAVETTSLTSPTTTTTTTTLLNSNGQIIQRIERTTATTLFSNTANGNLLVFSVKHGAPGMFDISRFNSSDDFSLEDCDERARLQRELEIREGVDAPPNFTPRGLIGPGSSPTVVASQPTHHATWHTVVCTPDPASLSLIHKRLGLLHDELPHRIHSQVDYIHCLVPDLQKITGCCFYWGKMDRYEAEKLLEGKPEGTFLLRDSAQEEFLFSVSFRKYNRSLHARIEQFNHKFSFDSRDPGVYTAPTVTGLLEHYKDPSCVMFFEPMLTSPLNRNFCFSLQQLCRATIVSHTTYDGINELCLPKTLKSYLKEYHYRQRVRVRPLDEHLYSNT